MQMTTNGLTGEFLEGEGEMPGDLENHEMAARIRARRKKHAFDLTASTMELMMGIQNPDKLFKLRDDASALIENEADELELDRVDPGTAEVSPEIASNHAPIGSLSPLSLAASPSPRLKRWSLTSTESETPFSVLTLDRRISAEEEHEMQQQLRMLTRRHSEGISAHDLEGLTAVSEPDSESMASMAESTPSMSATESAELVFTPGNLYRESSAEKWDRDTVDAQAKEIKTHMAHLSIS